MTKPLKVGLALGSGAARGWAHIGALQVLEAEKVPIDLVAGTSMGSLIGAVYLSGNLDALHKTALKLDWRSIIYYFFEPNIPRSGMVNGRRIQTFMKEFIQAGPIESLPKPYACVAADLMRGGAVVLKDGDLVEAVRASIAMPGILKPVARGKRVLVDGGVVDPVPVNVVREMGADFTIAIDVNHGLLHKAEKSVPVGTLERIRRFSDRRNSRILQSVTHRVDDMNWDRMPLLSRWMSPAPVPNIFDVIGNSVRIMEVQISEARLAVNPPDVLVRPEVGSLNILDFDKAEPCIEAGRIAMQEAMPSLREKLEAKRILNSE